MEVKAKEAQKQYEEYIKRFAACRNITEQQATSHKIVKEYKAYLENEYGVTIFENKQFKDQELKGSRWHQ